MLPADKSQMIADYESGESTTSIAKRLGLHPSTVWDVDHAARRYDLREDAFSSPLSPEAAYWIGFLITDGCVFVGRSGQTRITLALQTRDSAILDEFKRFLGTDMLLRVTKNRRGFGHRRGTGLVALTVTSSRMAADLARYGVVPRKSCSAVPLNGIDSLPAFWRGAVDGDGHMMWRKNMATIGMTGSLAMVRMRLTGRRVTANKCEEPVRHQGNVYHARVNSRAALSVVRILYEGASPALPRKLLLAQTIIREYEARIAAKVPPQMCSVPMCAEGVEGLGFCNRHYRRFRRYGSVHAVCRPGRNSVIRIEGGEAATPLPMRKRRCNRKPDGFLVP